MCITDYCCDIIDQEFQNVYINYLGVFLKVYNNYGARSTSISIACVSSSLPYTLTMLTQTSWPDLPEHNKRWANSHTRSSQATEQTTAHHQGNNRITALCRLQPSYPLCTLDPELFLGKKKSAESNSHLHVLIMEQSTTQ